jgi:MOSC domain-containing protein YiiM
VVSVELKGRVESVNRSRGGVPKEPVPECRVTETGLEGDRQRDLRFHGGPDRAVCVYSLERIEAFRKEGHPIAPGTLGENLTLSGLDWSRVVPPAHLEIGDVVLQLMKFAAPCENIADSFKDGDYSRVSEKVRPGWSRVCARVVQGGVVRMGDTVTLRT